MRKKILIVAAAVSILALSLTACDSLKKNETGEAGSGASASVQTSGTLEAVQGSAVQSTPEQNQNTAAPAGDTVQNTVSDDGPSGEIIPDEDAAAADNDAAGSDSANTADSWSGSYVGDAETVSIALLNETTISFAFAQSGISGTAAVNGMQAVYNGDDHYVVVFNLNGSILEVSVSNEEDYDASASPLNGTYMKE